MEDVYRKADRTSFVLYCLWIYIPPLLYFLQYYCLLALFVCLYPGYIDPLLPLQRLGSPRLYFLFHYCVHCQHYTPTCTVKKYTVANLKIAGETLPQFVMAHFADRLTFNESYILTPNI